MTQKRFQEAFDYRSLNFQRLGLTSIGLVTLLLLFCADLNQVTFISLSLLAGLSIGIVTLSFLEKKVQHHLDTLFCGTALVLLALCIHQSIQNNYLPETAYLNLVVAFMLSLFIRHKTLIIVYLAGFVFINFMGLVIADNLYMDVPLYGSLMIGTCLAVYYSWHLRNHLSDNNQRLHNNVFNYAKLYEKVFLNAPGGLAIIDANFKLLDVNKTLCRMLGYSAKELRALDPYDLVPEDSIGVDKEIYKNLFNQQIEQYNASKYFLKKDGSLLETESSFSLVKSRNDKSLYIVLVVKTMPEKIKIPVPVEKVKTRHEQIVDDQKYNQLVQKTHELDKIIQYLNRQSDADTSPTQQRMLESAMEGISELQMVLQRDV